MPRGGARPGAGRKPGQTTKAKMDMMSMARDHATEAFNVLMNVARDPKAPPAARVTAATAILDRGFGRPAQSVAVSPGDTPAEHQPTIDLSKLTPAQLQAYLEIAEITEEADTEGDDEPDPE